MSTKKSVTKQVKLLCFVHEYCMDNGKASALAPQLSEHYPEAGRKRYRNPLRSQLRFVWVPVCRAHKEGWWDGSDIPIVQQPPIIQIKN